MYDKSMRLSKTQNFIEDTKNEFQQYETEPLTDMQATEIQHNLFGVMDLLCKWGDVFIQESKQILKRIKRLLGAKDKNADLDLLLNNEEETEEYKTKQRFPYLK